MSLSVPARSRRLIRLVVLVAFSTCFTSAVSGRELFGGAQGGMTSGGSRFERTRIDSIVVNNRNVYDLGDPRYNRFPYKTANKLHFVTRKSVIERELLFRVGDPFQSELAEETARNLRTRLALYDAWVETESLPDGRLLIRVVTIDQWSLILFARLSRDANLTDIRFGFEERNLLGRNQLLSMEYFIPEIERNYVEIIYSNPRFMGRSVRVGAGYNSDPTNELKRVSVSHPYYNLLQVWSWGVAGDRQRVRTDDSARNRRSYSASDQVQLSLSTRWGTYHDKILVAGDYTYRSSETHATAYSRPDSIVAAPFDSTYHLFTLSTGFEHIYYVGLRRINGFNYTEDIFTGLDATFSLGRAVSRRWDSYLFDQLGLHVVSAWRMGNELCMVSYERTLWFPRNGPSFQSADMSFRFYETSLSWVTFALRARYRSDERDVTLYLGGDSGIRGYDKYYRGGDRLFMTNAEARLFPGISLLSVQFGSVLFVDAGRAYRPAEKFSFKDMTFSVGAGLRISFERAARSELARIDLAHTRVPRDGRMKSVWEFSIGHGQYF